MSCCICGHPILTVEDVNNAHQVHEVECPAGTDRYRGWCFCDAYAHADCCPTCKEGDE